jgi:hypothetical protein
MLQIGQGSYNPVVTPAGVLASQAHHQILDLRTGARPAGRVAPFSAVEFFSHQSAIPSKNSIRFGDALYLLQSFPSKRLPISASVARSPSDSRKPGRKRAFKHSSRPPGIHSAAQIPD